MSRVGPVTVVTGNHPLSAGSIVWWSGGAAQVTITLKARFGMRHEASARLVAPPALTLLDRHRDGTLIEASDLVPFIPNAGVVLSGAAHAERPVAAMTARLSVFRGRPLIDKSVHVFGDRAPGAASPQPFQVMPLVYERAFGGPLFEDNPVGTGATADARAQPNLVHPEDPRRPASFGPVSPLWRARRRLLRSFAEPVMGDGWLRIPEGFDYHWFQAAPADQQCDHLQGDEWIVLDGIHPTQPRLQTQLPSARAEAVWSVSRGPYPGEGRPVGMRIDTVIIDGEQQLCSLVWRGHFALEHPDLVPHVTAYARIVLPNYPSAWPSGAPLSPRAPLPAPVAPQRLAPTALPVSKVGPTDLASRFASPVAAKEDLDSTVFTPLAAPVAAALPFKRGEASLEPWAAPLPPPVPPPAPSRPRATWAETSSEHTTMLDGDAPSLLRQPLPPAAPPPPRWQPTPAQPRPQSTWADDSKDRTRMVDFDAAEAVPMSRPLPFAPAPPPAVPPSQPRAEAPPSRPSTWADDAQDRTRMVDFDAASARSMPFMTTAPEPAMRPRAPVTALPGAPWSETPVEPPSPPPPYVVAPPAMVAPPPMIAPPSEPAPPSPPPPAPRPPDSTPALPAKAEAAPPPSGLRADVLARIAAREPLGELALAGADLNDLDLSGAVMTRLDLKGARLSRCKLANARLGGAQLADADLSEADLTGADLSGADLSRANLSRARLDGATLPDANLSGARGPSASFVGAMAQRARLARGEWDGASLERADLAFADLTGASLAGARLVGATLSGARLVDARGRGAVFDDARMAQVQAQNASLPAASLRRVDAAGSVWEGATLDEACFAGATLVDANLLRASCLRADLSSVEAGGANLQRVIGDGADLHEARMNKADLRQARLRAASLERASLREVAAWKTDFGACRFTDASLEGAVLRGARCSGASFVRANLEGADLRDADLDRANVFGASRKTAKLGTGARGLVEVEPGPEPRG